MRRAILVHVLFCVFASVAHADETDETDEPTRHRVTHNAIVLHPAAFASRGVTLAYERAFPDARFSLSSRFAFAAPVHGDFRSRGNGFGLEGRFYFLGRGPFTRYERPAPVGPYLGARTHLTVTALLDRSSGRYIGRSERLSVELSVGCRFAIAGAVEISPFLGFILYSDFVEQVRPTLLPGFALGASVGVIFERRRSPSSPRG